MQELKFKNFLPTIVIFIIAAAASAGAAFLNTNQIELPLPLLTIGLFAGFLIMSFICYPKATTMQTVQITITGVFLNAGVIALALMAMKQANIGVSINSDFMLQINPLTPAISFLFSFISLISLIKFENITDKQEKLTVIHEEQPLKEEIPLEAEKIAFNIDKKDENIEKVQINEAKTEEKPKSAYEELYPQAKLALFDKKEESEQTEFLLNFSEEKTSTKQETFLPLDELPDFALEEKVPVQTATATLNIEQTKIEDESEEEYFDYIPTDIRLIEAPASKEKESKGKIGSIGKLLVNNRDIEGVIEAGTISSSENKTSVVSSESGEEIYEKFNKITGQFSQMKEIALIDKGGFVMACNCSDKMKMNITGALIAGAYHTLQNYLMQISFKNPQKIFFETEDTNNFIIKTGEELLFSIWEKEFKHIDLGELNEFLEAEEISASDFTPLIDLEQIKSFTMSDINGEMILSSGNADKAKKQAIIAAAVFENLKVFLMNLQMLKLKRISIFNAEETLIIQKNNDNIISFKTESDGMIKISDEFKKLEEIY
jgi:predicted regulator of Ras-like GTPase activity (Roadblock/LC7/MglB family)